MKTAEDLARDVERWRGAWAQVKVDMDRAVRAATGRALDCTEHGKLIADLEQQVHRIDTLYHQTNQARSALLLSRFRLHEALTALRLRIADGEQVDITTDDLAATVLRYLDVELRGHENAYKTTTKPAKLPIPDGAA